MFGYYAWHSFVNQLRKLFKTWVLVFLVVCLLMGMLIGGGLAALEDATGEEIVEEEVPEEVPEQSMEEALGISGQALAELVCGGIVLIVLVFTALGADKSGSQIFLPADVTLLFSSPMQPQSVLLFRLMTQVGASLLASIYLLFQIPNLVLNLGLDIWVSLTFILAWCLTLAMAKLVQILLYTVCSTHDHLKKYLRYGIFLLVGLVAVAFFLYWQQGGISAIKAAATFFNSPVSRWIPIWGWLKGICMFAAEGNLPGFLGCLGLILLTGGVLAWTIWHVKADFYEEAMSKAQETAELLEQTQKEQGVAVVRRKKERSQRLRRDGIGKGWGASMFFHKAMYNRFRFAHFKVFTKTSETYLVTALGVWALCRFMIGAEALVPVMLSLAGLAFYRSLGNPLPEDIQMSFFQLIPESAGKKLMWSLLGGSMNCLLDLLPATVLAVVLSGGNPLAALVWLLLVLTVDFFATTVSTFITLSTPRSSGQLFKQLLQIMFLYFGLLPDVVILVVGFVVGQPLIAALICAGVNILIGLVFFALTTLFIDPKTGKKPEVPFRGDLKVAKKSFSRLGFGAAMILIITLVLQVAAELLVNWLAPQWQQSTWGFWLISFLPMYGVAVPLGIWLMKKVPAYPLEQKKLSLGRFIKIWIISIFMMVVGNLAGTLVTTLLNGLKGVTAENPVAEIAAGSSVWPRLLFMVILAPIIEEYIFRKVLIDRMHCYGQDIAVLASALFFGLFHGNFSQLFYAFTLGLVFGYVYLKTGKLRYTIWLHMLINFGGGILAPWLAEQMLAAEKLNMEDPAVISSMYMTLVAFVVYIAGTYLLAVVGLILLILQSKKITFARGHLELPGRKKFKTCFLNFGAILLILLCLGMTALSLL